MKNNPEHRSIPAIIRMQLSSSVKTRPALAWLTAFFLCLVVILVNLNSSRLYKGKVEEFEVGRVADRDVIADQPVTYVDEKATQLRIEAEEHLVPAVFQYSYKITEELRNQWRQFVTLAGTISGDVHSRETYRLSLHSGFPGTLNDDVLDQLYRSQDRQQLLKNGTAVLDALLGTGIYSMPQTGLENLNPDVVELLRQSGSRIEQERVPLRNIVTRDNIAEAVVSKVAVGSYAPLFSQIAFRLLSPFLRENVFYSPDDTEKSLAATKAAVPPVMRSIQQGKRIIKKGFIITEDEVAELRALKTTRPGNDLPTVFSVVIFLLLVFGVLYYFSSRRIIGRDLTDREAYLVSGLSALYIAGSVLVKNISMESMPVSVLVPTALVIMLPSILIHSRLALVLAMVLPLGAFLTESFDTASFAFAVVSGVVASYTLQGAEKRMDLVKAGLIIAAANITAMTAVLLSLHSPAGVYPQTLFWAAFNGLASGMLVLGFLPPLEHALNAATNFRLIELSDLNAPILRRLFTTAPGTYSHSIMVANLAETACQDIGANPLLARVGAYYHDLGKMENPDYFVENQTDHNRHDDIAPSLSATVIRSHVKLGVEKARQLGLPQAVIDIIAEHHGDSVITWFYNKALQQEEAKVASAKTAGAKTADGDSKKSAVSAGDFLYPGDPPHSRESAVVMLADVTEAAVRTLQKPNAVRLERFIQELIAGKVEHGQLAQSELTFRDLETIKNAFIRVLMGYYHSRIEYPRADAPNNSKAENIKDDTG